jgi:hypothetical protein
MKEFKVGDKVWSPINDNGRVIEIAESDTYPIWVKFENNTGNSYTVDGKNLISDVSPTLFHDHDLILEVRKPKKVWVNVYWDKSDAFSEPELGGNLYDSFSEAQLGIRQTKTFIHLKTIQITVPE